MGVDYVKLQESLLDNIWAAFKETYTNINYASLYAESIRDKQQSKLFWVVYGCFAMPPIVTIILRLFQFDNPYLVILLCFLVLIPPLLIRKYNKVLAYSLFGFYENNISELLEHNVRLDIYKDKLLLLYFRAEAISATKDEIEKIESAFEKVQLEHSSDRERFDKLTGKICQEIEILAQDRTDEMIRNANYYGKETAEN